MPTANQRLMLSAGIFLHGIGLLVLFHGALRYDGQGVGGAVCGCIGFLLVVTGLRWAITSVRERHNA